MKQLLDYLAAGRTEDTITECLAYLIESQPDGGLSVVNAVFGINAQKVKVLTQTSIMIPNGERIVPDIGIMATLSSGDQKGLVVECKYGDPLDATKKRYFTYFSNFPNCDVYLLCSHYEKAEQEGRMADLKLPFKKVVTFDDFLTKLAPVNGVTADVLSFLRQYSKDNYKYARTTFIDRAKKLENQSISIRLPTGFQRDLVTLWTASHERNYASEYDYNSNHSVLEFEGNHSTEGEILFSINNHLDFGALLVRSRDSMNPFAAPLVGFSNRRTFHNCTRGYLPEISHQEQTSFIKELFDYFASLVRGVRYLSYTTFEHDAPAQEYVVIGFAHGFSGLEIAFKNEAYLRIRIGQDHLFNSGAAAIQDLRNCADITELSNLTHWVTKKPDPNCRAFEVTKFCDAVKLVECIRKLAFVV